MSQCVSECRRAAEQTAGLVHRAAGIGTEVTEGYTETEYVYLTHHVTCLLLVDLFMLIPSVKGVQVRTCRPVKREM